MHPTNVQIAHVAIHEYDDIRPHLRTGDLLLCAGSSVMSRMIQRATRSSFSHIALLLRIDAIDRILILESVESRGVRAVPLSHYLRDYDRTGRRYPGRLFIARHDQFQSLTHAHRQRFVQTAFDLLGWRYDTKEILRIASRIARRIASTTIFNDRFNDRPLSPSPPLPLSHSSVPAPASVPAKLPRDEALICSEYAWECFAAAGIRIPHDHRGFISPADFTAAADVEILWQISPTP